MATTTNYGWTTPDNTALVKDGASAIRTLGSSVDTSLKSLSPGTTAGDVDYYTSSTAKARLGIGTTGQVLTVAGGVPSWATPASGGMTLISTTTLTGASVVLSSIPQTYNQLYLIIKNFKPATDNRNLNMRFNDDSTASRHGEITTYGNNTNQTFGATNVNLALQNDDTVATGLVSVTIPDYTNTATWKMCSIFSIGVDPTTTTNYSVGVKIGVYNQTSAITSLGFITNSGNFTSGTALLYGVK
jgi:hypothetical protein